eukprot:560061-Karenia_brevis.AAC.1
MTHHTNKGAQGLLQQAGICGAELGCAPINPKTIIHALNIACHTSDGASHKTNSLLQSCRTRIVSKIMNHALNIVFHTSEAVLGCARIISKIMNHAFNIAFHTSDHASGRQIYYCSQAAQESLQQDEHMLS